MTAAGSVSQRLRCDRPVGRYGQPVGDKELFADDLVHRQAAGQHTAPHIRYARQFQQPLHGAILTVRAVQYREDHVQRGKATAGGAGHQLAAGRGGLRVGRRRGLFAGRQRGQRITARQPAAVVRDADGHNLVLVPIHHGHDRARRSQRDFMLAGAAAKYNAHA